ncbi:uncharacterized protein ACN2A1_009129 isoform 1-T3 [Glossina fuscipes fuscipes]
MENRTSSLPAAALQRNIEIMRYTIFMSRGGDQKEMRKYKETEMFGRSLISKCRCLTGHCLVHFPRYSRHFNAYTQNSKYAQLYASACNIIGFSIKSCKLSAMNVNVLPLTDCILPTYL